MSKRAASWVSFTLCAVLLAGCGAGSHAAAEESDGLPTATSTTAPAPTTTTVPPPYSFDGSVPPPPLLNTGTDYAAIYRSLSAYATWLLAHHPEPDLVREAYVVGTPVYDRLKSDVALVQAGDARMFETEQPLKVEATSVLTSAVALHVTETVTTQRLVRRDGTTIQEQSFTKPFEWSALLQSDSAGRWRIATVDPLGS